MTIQLDNVVKKIQLNLKTYTMIIALLFLWGLFGILTNGRFLSPWNLSNLFRQMTIIAFLSIGMVLVIVTGNIDLSVGSVCGFISAIAAYLQVTTFPAILPQIFPYFNEPFVFIGIETTMNGLLSTGLTLIICLGIGLIIGIWHGTITAYLGVPAFIVTLGGMLIFRGGVLDITQGKTLVPIENSLRAIAQGYLPDSVGIIIAIIAIGIIFFGMMRNRNQKKTYGLKLAPIKTDIAKSVLFAIIILAYVIIMNMYRGFQTPVFLMVGVAIIFTYISSHTRFGRYCYAIGGNKEATRLSGVNIKKTIFKVFMLMGLLCGVSGTMLTGYVAAGTIGGGNGYELSAIAACVIGGTSLMGGEGTIAGALVGALIMASLENGMSVMNMPVQWQYYAKGLVLILAVFIDVASKRKAWLER